MNDGAIDWWVYPRDKPQRENAVRVRAVTFAEARFGGAKLLRMDWRDVWAKVVVGREES